MQVRGYRIVGCRRIPMWQTESQRKRVLHHIVTDAGGLTLLHPIANRLTAKPDEGSLELTEEIMRLRAYRLFEERGYEHGHDLEDWLRAKTEIFGKELAEAA